MPPNQPDILSRLQKEILQLQGLRPMKGLLPQAVDPGPLASAFPETRFPEGVVHEFIANGLETSAASGGFISTLLAALLRNNGIAIWISAARTIFPPALQAFGIDPHKVIFIDVKSEKQALQAVEEALKCTGITAVVGELKELSFKDSRRLQLAVEHSHVTGFLLRNNPRSINTTACVTRWQISSLPGEIIDELPGVGFPRWKVQLLKVRNGKPGSWELSWRNGRFYFHDDQAVPEIQPQKKTG